MISPLSGQFPQVDRWESFQTVGLIVALLEGPLVTVDGKCHCGRQDSFRASELRGGRRWWERNHRSQPWFKIKERFHSISKCFDSTSRANNPATQWVVPTNIPIELQEGVTRNRSKF